MHLTSPRQKKAEQFLQNYFGKDSYSITPIQGDAGFRSYFRLKVKSKLGCPHTNKDIPKEEIDFRKTYILMDCPPSYCSTRPFIDIANYLRSNGFSTPEIIVYDMEQGFIILEDLGDISIKALIQNSERSAKENIYYLIIDLLVSIQNCNPFENLKIYDNNLLLSELSLFEEWYILYSLGRKLKSTESLEYKKLWQEALNNQVPLKQSLILRDYHAENMMYLEHRSGINSIGLLDFQDALIGSPIYDLVSVLEDARIEVPFSLALECLSYFAKIKKLDLEKVLINYHILGAQRNSRILGVFARKSLRDKNDNYLQYIPLVLKYLEHDLAHPMLDKLLHWYAKTIKL